jgi:hypothetical protein
MQIDRSKISSGEALAFDGDFGCAWCELNELVSNFDVFSGLSYEHPSSMSSWKKSSSIG